MSLGAVELEIPGTSLRMGVAPEASPEALARFAIVVVSGEVDGPAIAFEVEPLREALGSAWPAVERVLESQVLAEAWPELRARASRGELLAAAVKPLSSAEARLVTARDDGQAQAVLVLLALQARIADALGL